MKVSSDSNHSFANHSKVESCSCNDFKLVDPDEIKRQVLVLAREGFLLPTCPKCGIPLHLDSEALAGKCDACGAKDIPIEAIPWIKTDTFPQA